MTAAVPLTMGAWTCSSASCRRGRWCRRGSTSRGARTANSAAAAAARRGMEESKRPASTAPTETEVRTGTEAGQLALGAGFRGGGGGKRHGGAATLEDVDPTDWDAPLLRQ